MPLVNQRPPTEFNTVGPFDNSRDYDIDDRVSYNGMSYVAPEPIPAGEGPPNPGTNRWIDDPGSEGDVGRIGVTGDHSRAVYIRSATTPPAPTGTWDGNTLTLSGGWQETIPSGTETLWRSDVTLDNVTNTATFTAPHEWRGPVGPPPTDTHLNTLISAALAAAISAGNIQSAAEVLQQIVDYLNNNDYLQESRIQDLINNTLSSLIATDGLIDVDYSTDQVDWLPELAAYRYVRLRGSNPNAPYHVIDLGIVAAQGGTATMLGVNIEYSIDDTTWHDPPRHTDDNWFRFTVGTGGTPSDGLPLSGAGGGGVTNLDVENITGTGFDITSSTGTDASVPAATTTDAGLLIAADKTKLDGLDDDRQLPDGGTTGQVLKKDSTTDYDVSWQDDTTGAGGTDLSLANHTGTSLDILSNTGADVTLPSASQTEAGLQSAADKTKLDGIAAGAQVNVDTDLSVANRGADTLDIASSTGTDATVPSATPSEAGLQSAADKAKLNSISAGAHVNVDTDLSIANRNASTLDIASSTGTDATVPAATTTEAGLQSAADKTKLDGIADGAEVNVATDLSIGTHTGTTLEIDSSTGTNATLPAATTSEAGVLSSADKTKLDGIETGATADQTAPEIKTAYESNADTNAFTDAEQTKLAGIAAGAEVNVGTDLSVANRTGTSLEIESSTGTDATVPEASTTEAGLLNATDKTKLDGLADNRQLPSGGTTGQVLKKDSTTDYDVSWQDDTSGAGGTNLSIANRTGTTLDVASSTGTDATIPAASGSEAGLMTDAQYTKLDGIETGATADQTAAEIKTAYESNPNTNAFDDTEQTKLAGIEAGAQVNVGTDLSVGTHTGTSIEIDSSTGADVAIPSATTTEAGVLNATDKTKLDALAANRQIPAGGVMGQVLKKDTAADYDVSWQNDTGGGGSGATNANQLTVDATNFGNVIPNTVANAQEAFDAIDDSVIDANNVGQVIATLTLSGAITQTQSDALGGWVLDGNAPTGFAVVDSGGVTDAAVQLSQTKISDDHDGYWVRIAMGGSAIHDFNFAVGAGNNSAVGGNTALNTLDLLIDAHAGDPDTLSIVSQTTQSPTLAQDVTITLYLKITGPAVVARNGNTDLGIDRQTGDSLEITSSTGTNATLRAATIADAGLQSATDKDKLDNIEDNATADQTATEIKTAYESNPNTNAFTDAEQTKLTGIEPNATADQTAAEIKTAYESNADTNAFTDAEQSKLAGIAAGAEVNVDADLSIANHDGDSLDIESSTGTDITLNSASQTEAGLQSAADKTKLDGIAASADANVPTNLAVMNRTGSQLDVSSSTGTDATIESATTTDAGLLSAQDKTKLDGLAINRQLLSGGGVGQVLKKDSTTDYDVSWQDDTGGGGGGATNLSITNRNIDTLDVASDTGTDATIPAATTTEAGLLIATDKTKLDALAANRQLPSGGDTGQVLKKDSTTDYDVSWQDDAGGSGSTDLAIANRTTTTLDITSSSGTDATVPEASGSEAGLLGAADKTKLDDLATNRQLPAGGTAGQVLRKDSTADYDATWQDGATGTSLADYNPATTYSAGQMAWFTSGTDFTGVVISRQNGNTGNTPAVRERTAWWDILSGSDISQIEEFYAAEDRLPDATTSWRIAAGTTAGIDGIIEANPASRWYDSIADIPEDRQHLTKWRTLIHSKNYGQIVSTETPSPVVDPAEIAQSQAATETSFPVEPFDIDNFENYAGYAFTRSIDGTENVNLVDLTFYDVSGDTALESDVLYQSNDRGRLDLNEIGAQCSRLRLANSITGMISVRVSGVYAEIMGTITHTPTKMTVSGAGYLEVAFSQSHTHIAWTTLDPNSEPGVRMMGGTVTLTEATTANTNTQAMIVVARMEPVTGTTPSLAAGDPTNYPAVFARDAHGVRFQSIPYSYPIPTTDFDDTIDVSDVFILGYTQNNLTIDTAEWQFFANNTLQQRATAGAQVTSPIVVSGASADLWYILWTDTLSTEATTDFSVNIIQEPFGDGLYGAVDRKAVIHPEATIGPQGRPGLHAVARTASGTFTAQNAINARGQTHWINDASIGNFTARVSTTDYPYWEDLEAGDLLTGWIDDDNYCQVEITARISRDSNTGQVNYEFAVLDLQGRVNGRSGETIELRSAKPEQGEDGIQGDPGRVGRPNVYVSVRRIQSADDTPDADEVRVTDPSGTTGTVILNTTGTGFDTGYLADVPNTTGIIVERAGTAGSPWIGTIVGKATSGDLITYNVEWVSRTGFISNGNTYDVSFGHTPAGGTALGELGYSANAFSITRNFLDAINPTDAQIGITHIANVDFIYLRRSGLTEAQRDYVDNLEPETPVNIYTADFSKRLNAVINSVTLSSAETYAVLHYTPIAGGTKGAFADGDALTVVFGGRGLAELLRHFAFNVSDATELAGVTTTGDTRIVFATIDQDFDTYRRHDLLFHDGSDWQRIYRIWLEYSDDGETGWTAHNRNNDERWARFVINGLPSVPFLYTDAEALFGTGKSTAVMGTFSIIGTTQTLWEDGVMWALNPASDFDVQGTAVEFTGDGTLQDVTFTLDASMNDLSVGIPQSGVPNYSVTNAEIWLSRVTSPSAATAEERITIAELMGGPIALTPGSEVDLPFQATSTTSLTEPVPHDQYLRIEVVVVTNPQDTQNHVVVYANDLEFGITATQRNQDVELYIEDGVLKTRNPSNNIFDLTFGDALRARALYGQQRTHTYTPVCRFNYHDEWERGRTWANLGRYFTQEGNRLKWHGPPVEITIDSVGSQDAEEASVVAINTSDADILLTNMELVLRRYESPNLAPTENIVLGDHGDASVNIPSRSFEGIDVVVGDHLPVTFEMDDGHEVELAFRQTPAQTGHFYIAGGNVEVTLDAALTTDGVKIDIETDGQDEYLRYTDPLLPTDEQETRLIELTKPELLIPHEPKRLIFTVVGQKRLIPNYLSGAKSLTIGTEGKVKIPFNTTAYELDFGATEDIVRHLNADDVAAYVDAPIGAGDESGVLEFQKGLYDLEAHLTIQIESDDDLTPLLALRRGRYDDVTFSDHRYTCCATSTTTNKYYVARHEALVPHNDSIYRFDLFGTYEHAFNISVTNHVSGAIVVTNDRIWSLSEENVSLQRWARSHDLEGNRQSTEDQNIGSHLSQQPRGAEYHNGLIYVLSGDTTGDGVLHVFTDDFSTQLASHTLPFTRGSAYQGLTIINNIIYIKQGNTVRAWRRNGTVFTHVSDLDISLSGGTFTGLTYNPVQANTLLVLDQHFHKVRGWNTETQESAGSDEKLDDYRYFHAGSLDRAAHTISLATRSITLDSAEQLYYESDDHSSNINVYGYLLVKQLKAL